MNLKRLIGCIIVKDNLAVQSFSFKNYLPIGKPEYLAENLDRWGVDEILVLDISRTKNSYGPNLKVIENIVNLSLKTPLIYGGGIRDLGDVKSIIKNGVERVVIDTLLHSSLYEVKKISDYFGKQSLIGSFPIIKIKNKLSLFDYRTNILKDLNIKLYEEIISEALIIDVVNEGNSNSFDTSILNHFQNQKTPLIYFGGLNNINKIKFILSNKNTNGVGLGNFLNYKENAVQKFKDKLKSLLRPPYYDRIKNSKGFY